MRGSCSGIYKSTALNPFYFNKNYRLCYRVTTSLSQIKEWCFPFHFTHELLLIHSEAHCLVPVQLKHNFLLDSVNPHSSISLLFAVNGFMPRFLTRNTVSVLITLIICLIRIFMFEIFLRVWNYFRTSGSPLSWCINKLWKSPLLPVFIYSTKSASIPSYLSTVNLTYPFIFFSLFMVLRAWTLINFHKNDAFSLDVNFE